MRKFRRSLMLSHLALFLRRTKFLGRLETGCRAFSFASPLNPLAISCPLRVESHLYYKVERIFYSLDSFLLLLPRFLLRPIVFRRMHNYVPHLLDMNAGRVRYDYLERLQSSMTRFENDLSAAITIVTESLKSALHTPGEKGHQYTETLGVLDSVIRDCSCLER